MQLSTVLGFRGNAALATLALAAAIVSVTSLVAAGRAIVAYARSSGAVERNARLRLGRRVVS